MDRKSYYMSLSADLAGSITKNRFRIELLWGINKLIDAHKENSPYTVIFDFKCDIELHKHDEIEFYQIKSKKKGGYTLKNLCEKKGKSQNSILGKLYALYTTSHNIKLAVVCNRPLMIGKKPIDFEEYCLGTLDDETIEFITQTLCDELNLESIFLDKVFYIVDNIDLLNPEDSIRGKLIRSFVDLKGEEPQNPNALYRLVFDSVKSKASYEGNCLTYEEVIEKKGLTRDEFDNMLEAHINQAKNGINETKIYINELPLAKRRRYNIALSKLLEIQSYSYLISLKLKIYNYIKENEDLLDNVENYLLNVSKLFNDEFDIEFTDEMKIVQYLMIYYKYALGENL